MPSKRKHTVAAIGEVLWDLFPEGKHLGGAPFNVVCTAQALNISSYMIGRVGNDKYGEEILEAVSECGISTRYITKDSNHSTGTVTVGLDENGNPDFTIHKNTAWDYIEWNDDLELLAFKCDAIVFGSLAQRSPKSQETILHFIKSTAKKCIRVFDVNLRQHFFNREIIEESLRLSDILKINSDELLIVSNLLALEGDVPEIIECLIDQYSLSTVALTEGSNGSLLVGNGKKSYHPGCKVDVVDTVGAGDAFTAGLIAGLLKGYALDRINKNANNLAAYVCTQRGALPKIPDSIKALFDC